MNADLAYLLQIIKNKKGKVDSKSMPLQGYSYMVYLMTDIFVAELNSKSSPMNAVFKEEGG